MLTRAELAAYYRVSEKTIARMQAEGMPAHQVRGRPRYDLAETETWTREKACRSGKTNADAGTPKRASNAAGFTAAFRKAHLRALPSALKPS